MANGLGTMMPTLFVPHGGGPWPWVEEMEPRHGGLRGYLSTMLDLSPPPKAVLMVSAHWEAAQPKVTSSPRPPMLYDYYNFPQHTYAVDWPAPGDPELAERVIGLSRDRGIEAGLDDARGFDHGCFVPMAIANPDATLPTVQISLIAGLDPARHYALGEALAPLREEGVLIVGSGMSYHNMQGFRLDSDGGAPHPDSETFDAWLGATADLSGDARRTRLVEWATAPAARACHPREEHLLPLHVVAGAAHEDPASTPYRDVVLGTRVRAIRFGR